MHNFLFSGKHLSFGILKKPREGSFQFWQHQRSAMRPSPSLGSGFGTFSKSIPNRGQEVALKCKMKMRKSVINEFGFLVVHSI